jgi:hypothetical protein
MHRMGLLRLLLAFVLAGSLGCGNKPQVKRGTDPFKARQDTQKGTKRDKFMMPKEVKTDK